MSIWEQVDAQKDILLGKGCSTSAAGGAAGAPQGGDITVRYGGGIVRVATVRAG